MQRSWGRHTNLVPWKGSHCSWRVGSMRGVHRVEVGAVGRAPIRQDLVDWWDTCILPSPSLDEPSAFGNFAVFQSLLLGHKVGSWGRAFNLNNEHLPWVMTLKCQNRKFPRWCSMSPKLSFCSNGSTEAQRQKVTCPRSYHKLETLPVRIVYLCQWQKTPKSMG